jgi:hypothetical protein
MIINLQEMFGGSPNEISRHLFEIYGHIIFLKGGMTLKCRSLEDDSISKLLLTILDGQIVTFGKNQLPQTPPLHIMNHQMMIPSPPLTRLAVKECFNSLCPRLIQYAM